MTINSETRVAGPFDGNDSTVSFPFTFKVFDSDEVRVVAETGAVETDLELGTDYTVTLNADQNAAPGGSVVLAAPLATGTRLTLTSALEMLQPVDLTNQSGFYPRVINNALDRLTILLQQLASVVSRTLKFPLSDGPVGDLPGRAARAGTVLAFDEATGEPVAGPDIASVNGVAGALVAINTVSDNITDVNTVAGNIADLSNFSGVYYGPSATDPTTRRDGSPLQVGDLYFNTVVSALRTYTGSVWRGPVTGAVTVQNLSGDGVETAFLLNYAPESEVITNVFISGVYQQKNTYDLGGANGDVLIFREAPPAGTNNIEVVVSSLTPSDDKLRQDLAAVDGAGKVGFSPSESYPAGTVGEALRGTIKPAIAYDWNGTSGTDGAPAIQQAIDSTVKVAGTVNRGAIELFGGGEFAISAQVEIDQKALLLSGNKALVKWTGSGASASMFRIVDSSQCHLKDLALIGDATNPPFAAIYGEALSPRRVKGTNEYCTLENIIIGRRFMLDTNTGGSVSTDGAGKVQNGIVIGGAFDGDNDEWHIRNVQVNGHTGVAFDFRSTQSIWSSVYDTCANNGGTGYRLGCNLTMFNVTSNRQTVADIEGIRNIEVSIFGIQAEHSNVFILSKSGASFFVKGGELQMKTATPGNFFRWENGGSMVLEDLYVENIESGHKTVYYRPGSTKGGIIRVRNCTIQGGNLRDTWDIDTSRAVGDPVVEIDIKHGAFHFKSRKPYADRAVTPPAIADGGSGLVGSGPAATPLGDFFDAAYQGNPQSQHITPSPELNSQIRARIFNVSGAAITLAAGRMRWMNLGDHVVAKGAATIDVPLMANNTGYTATIRVPGVRLGDFVAWGAGGSYINNVVTAYASAEDTVSLRIHNATGGNSAPGSTILYAAKLREFGNFHGALYYAVPSIAQGETQTFTVPVPGAQRGGHAFVAYTKDLQGLLCTAHVSATDTVSIILSNFTGGSVTLAPGAFKVMVAF